MNTLHARWTQLREVCLVTLLLASFGWLGLCTSVAAEPGDSGRRPGTVTLLRLLDEMRDPASLARWQSEEWSAKEDYYGYSWGERALFYAPFHSQNKTPEGPGWLGTTVNTRLRSLDAIPFQKSLDLDMEVWTHDSSGSVQKHVDYGVATYWYGFPGTRGTWVSATVRKQR